MRVLIACECSGIVRDALRARGHDAWSCDLKPCEGDPQYHLKGDCFRAIMGHNWDGIILHPPCTAMGLCGNRWYGKGMPRHAERIAALNWTENLVAFARERCPRVAVEQPKSTLCQRIGKRTQAIHPWQFGHMEQKETWLWLYGLPPLTPTTDVYAAMMLLPKKKRERIFYMSPGENRGTDRSRTFTGIASAMAAQWGYA